MVFKVKPKVSFNKISLLCMLGLVGAGNAYADFIDDYKGSIYLRNFYVERDFENPASSDIGSWSQAATLRLESGYTDTALKVGVDVLGQYAVRLNDMHADLPDSILPYDYSKGEQERSYGKAGATLKLKYNNSEFKVGTLEPKLPVIFFDDSRQLTTIFSGALFQSKDIKDLVFTAGFINRINARNDDEYEKLSLFTGSAVNKYESDGLGFVGLDYNFTPSVSGSYWYGQLLDIYQQHYANLAYSTKVGDTKVRLDGRYFNNSESGKALYGDIDNQSYGFMTTINTGNHTLATGVRKNDGKSTFPTISGYVPQPFLHAWSLLGFVKPEELTWHVLYSYDFKGWGVPGLSTTLRYLHGSDIYRAGYSDNTEIERSAALKYVVPEGKLKNFGLEYIHYDTDTKYGTGYARGNSFDEDRVIASYTYKF
ncbi:OprD family outer membrane porin [Acinetobacter baumannii]|uniref:Outer membrane porin, OprD family protein n=2 Tax=Moraxellaceae TaxID=468 RepID=A0A009S145_ACIBA|nr:MULTISPECIES: OprD family outer membrane porin [Acinetobacter]EXC47222.1 outer membrane porin, OprD family protein [Acinetobacter baumannii 99063]MCT9505405.1 OprD family porin [Acinetobacter baumannii]MCT9515035.1 OprD family porin [Acinetobacter baumannii]MCZ3132918.1 OprD family porin [Acinetobacter baumannii]MDI9726150.1 OprD family outer membrane porin [Acinetobacter baumannii]